MDLSHLFRIHERCRKERNLIPERLEKNGDYKPKPKLPQN